MNSVSRANTHAEAIWPSQQAVKAPVREARLLLTKILPPRAASALLGRQLANEMREEAQLRDLLVLAAGPGYGKTSVLSTLAAREDAVAWLTLTASDRAPHVFLNYLTHTLARALGAPPPPSVTTLCRHGTLNQSAGIEAVEQLAAWVEQVLNGTLLVVLDEYHNVSDTPGTEALVQALLERLPAGLHLLIGTRSVPDWQLLPCWQESGRAAVYGNERLRFHRDEVAGLLRTAGSSFSDVLVEQLVTIAEGWPLGLKVLTDVLRQLPGGMCAPTGEDLMSLVNQNAGPILSGYFSTVVLMSQSPAIRRFLVRAAVLDIMTPPDCDAVLQRTDSGDILRELERRNLFVVPTGRSSWRFHNLFRQFLLRDGGAHPRHLELRVRAATHLEARGDMESAIPHWLAARRFDRAAACVKVIAQQVIRAGRHELLASWLEGLPGGMVSEDSDLLYWRGYLLEARGLWQEAYTWYRLAAKVCAHASGKVEPAEIHDRLAIIAGLYQGLPLRARRHAQAALSLVETVAGPSRGRLLRDLAAVYLSIGHLQRAEELLNTAQATYQRHGSEEGKAWTDLYPGHLVPLVQGDFKGSLARLDEFAQFVAESAQPEVQLQIHAGRALNYLLMGRYAEARAAAGNALDLAEMVGPAAAEAWVNGILGWTWQFGPEADAGRATGHLERCLDLSRRTRDTRGLIFATIAQIRLAYRSYNRVALAESLARCREYLNRSPDRWLTTAALANMGLALAMAQPSEARRLLQRGLRLAAAMGNRYHETLARLGLALVGRDNPEEVARHLPAIIDGVNRYGTALLGGDFAVEMWLLVEAAHRMGLRTGGLTRLASPPPTTARVAVHTLGRFAVAVGGASVSEKAWGGSRALALFKLLAAHHPHGVYKEEALQLLWGHLSAKAAENNLNKTLHQLRRALDAQGQEPRDRFVILRGKTLRLAPDVWVDAAAYMALLEEAEKLESAGDKAGAHRKRLAAEQLWKGEFLPEDTAWGWVTTRRRQLREHRVSTLERIATYAIDAGNYPEAIMFLKRAAEGDPRYAEVHQHLAGTLSRHTTLPSCSVNQARTSRGPKAVPSRGSRRGAGGLRGVDSG